jgi:hypothetical protein
MAGTILTLIGSLFTLVIMILKEYFARSSEAAKRQQEYKLSVEEFDNLVSTCLTRMREQARKESDQAKNVEDQVDGNVSEREQKK